MGDRVACPEDPSAGRRQSVFNPAAAAGAAGDQVLGGEPVGQRSKRLIGLERLHRKGVGGGARSPADCPQSVPLGKRRPNSGKLRVERAVVPVLNLLDGSSQSFQVCRHPSIITD
jgi:hypothetical protein